MYNQYSMTEYPLVRVTLESKPKFQVCKAGIEFLRQLRHKKLRVIYNIVEGKKDLQLFNHKVLNCELQGIQQEELGCQSMVTICGQRELPENRSLICMNVYCRSNAEKIPSQMALLGYQIASAFFYHCQAELKEESALSSLLRDLNEQLSSTNMEQLQEQIKNKAGFIPKPEFKCLLYYDTENPAVYFQEFYHEKQGSAAFNESVQALTDHFCERSAFVVDEHQKMMELGNQFAKETSGRRILNFEVTGYMIESLCHELCEVYNSQSQTIDLIKIFNRIISQQKHNVKGHSDQLYNHLTQQIVKSLPKPMPDLKDELSSIERKILQDNISTAVNCMDLIEYQPILKDLMHKFEKLNTKIADKNEDQLRSHAENLLEELVQGISLFEVFEPNNLSSFAELIKEKLDIFMEEVIYDENAKNWLSNLLEKYLHHYSESAQLLLTQHSQRTDSTEKMEKLQKQNMFLKAKNKQLQKQFQYQLQLNNQYKLKLEEKTSVSMSIQDQDKNKQIMHLKKQNREQEEELKDKQIQILELEDILEKFDYDFEKKSNKHKFSKEAHNILVEINNKVNSVHQLFNKLKEEQETYLNYFYIEKQFEKRKKVLEEEMENEKKNISALQRKLETASEEKHELKETINTEKKIIEVTQETRDKYEGLYNELQMKYALLQGQKADIDCQLQNYQKALNLVNECFKTGRLDDLRKYIKVVGDDDLRETLKEIIRR